MASYIPSAQIQAQWTWTNATTDLVDLGGVFVRRSSPLVRPGATHGGLKVHTWEHGGSMGGRKHST